MSDSEDYGFLVINGETTRLKFPRFEEMPEYPVDWFKKNKKPKLVHDFAKDQNLATARSNVHAFLSGSTTNPTIPLEYLYYVCETITDELAEDWVSYGVKIPKGKVTPLSLLDLTQWTPSSNREITANGPQQLNANADLYLLAMLMGACRVSSTHFANRSAMQTRVMSTILRYKPGAVTLSDISLAVPGAGLLISSKNFNMLASALDMFLCKFPKHRFHPVRVGTIFYRYQACSGLENFTYARSLLGKENTSDIFPWFFAHGLATDIQRMFIKKKDELEKMDSYFPYMIGMGLSKKSPYSASVNKDSHFMIHVLGSLMHNVRSINARYREVLRPDVLAQNSCLIYIAHRHKIKQAAHTEKNTTQEGVQEGLEQMTPSSCVRRFVHQNSKFTPEELGCIQTAISGLPVVRPGSIGEWVKNHLLTRIN